MAREPRPKPDISITPKPKAPSEWSPRPIPTPGVGRSTADPRTPTLRELAQRAAERASLTSVPNLLPAFTDIGAEGLPAADPGAEVWDSADGDDAGECLEDRDVR